MFIGDKNTAAYIQSEEIKNDPITSVNPHSFQSKSFKPKYGYPHIYNTFTPPCFLKTKIDFGDGKVFMFNDAYVPIDKFETKIHYSFHGNIFHPFINKYLLWSLPSKNLI
jgi:hypothetical protein